jgi:predicted dehydrogenase
MPEPLFQFAAEPLRWGILSTAKINDRLLPAFAKSQSSRVVAVGSRDLSKSRVYAQERGIPRAYGSYEELLADPDIDAIYNPLPNHLHGVWTCRAADHGKHVLCEKPLTVTAAEAEEVVAYCQAKSVRLMDGFMWPHHPRTAKIRAVLDAGTIGTVQKVHATFTFNLEQLPTTNIRMQPEAGGGGLLDVGCYTTYAIRWWMQAEPVKVFARAVYVNDVDVAMSGVWTFADGRTATFDCGFTHPLRTHVEIVGTTGTIRIPNQWIPDDRAAFEIIRQSGDFGHTIETLETPGEDQIVHMIDHFAAAVRSGQDCTPHPQEAIRTARVLDALARSARSGVEVPV